MNDAHGARRDPGPSDDNGGDDEALLAELFDSLLQAVLDGDAPDLDGLMPDRPDLRGRVRETFELACSVAGRREPGRPMLGGYEILRELGRGGMGTVYLARHEALEREVAIKVLPQSLALSARAKRRFLDEARSLARLRHDHIVHIHRIVDHAEMLAFEMEYVEGPSLQKLLLELRKHGPRPLPEQLAAALGPDARAISVRSTVEYFVKLGIAIARALAEVHRRGLVHRDVKPSNILLRRNGTPVLADFGLARDGDLAMTQTISFAGTPIYAAPERLRDGDLDLDGRADVYSLGVTLYEAITLSPPYQGRSTQDVLRKIENGHIVPLRQRAPHVSRDLQTVVLKAMDPEPRHRYATAGDFADDLERLLTLQPIRARPRGPVRRLVLAVRRQRKPLLGAVTGALLVTLALWPWFANLQAASTARERADRHTQQARLLLLQPDCLDLAGRRSLGAAATGRLQAALPAQVEALREVRTELDAACAAAPDDDGLRQERAVLATVLWLRTASPDRTDEVENARHDPAFVAATTDLPPLTRKAAQLLVAGPIDRSALRPQIEAASPTDRFALGLLAALLGEVATCESAWVGLEDTNFDHPLLNAGLGLLAAADGSPQRAYPRLFHATRTFPGSRFLAFELADAALATGDPGPARQWLADQDAEDAEPLGAAFAARRQRLEADVLAAAGHLADAEASYREIMQRWPDDATARHRLATLAIQRGDLHRSRQYLLRIAQDWPDNALVRLDLARLALQVHNGADYLQQARYALARGIDREGSQGVLAVLSEILRLGGLASLSAEFGDGKKPVAVDWRHIEPPTPLWSGPVAVQVEADLRVLAAYDSLAGHSAQAGLGPLAAAMRTAQELALRHGNLLRPAPLLGRTVLAIAPLALRIPDLQAYASMALLPFQSNLGTPLQLIHNQRLLPHIDLDSHRQSVTALATLGIVDGTEELLVGVAPVSPGGKSGRVEVRAGSDGTPRGVLSSPNEDMIFGYSLCDVGDLDGDAIADFAVGAPLQSRTTIQSGRVLIYSGRDHTLLRELTGKAIGFGVALANLGDVDGDGKPDLCVGTSPEMRNSTALGGATVFSGADGSVLYALESDRAGVWFGAAVAAVGDLDGDGCRDLIVGGNHGGAPGLVAVHSGRSGTLLFVLEGDSDSVDFGRVVAGIDDIDGDRVPDLAVSEPEAGNPRRRPGRVLLFSGRSGQRVAVLPGDDAGDLFGMAVCRLPDWLGDGRPAIAVTAMRQGSTGSGYVRVFGLRPLRPLQTFFLPPGLALFGRTLAALGDHDGRGRPRLAANVLHETDGGILAFTYALDGK